MTVAQVLVSNEESFIAAIGSNDVVITLKADITLTSTISISGISNLFIHGNGFSISGGWDGEVDDDDYEHYYQYSDTGIRCLEILESNSVQIQDLVVKDGFAGGVSRFAS